ncbi:MAG: carbamoyl phosphate synthase small subunit [Omnitrophica WOR_2 bacterium GWF2_43_52]|nr:MAG: carbamoyl phosphate synthase small subunit [Omnitrophica WOR_2 bacterium GWC2_44_8]OGX20408.1 MAG: carbamoyl phosphate synthase small subunit [Omnitrophica WOR_2 bacterium GWF2_43_52]OGX57428.1 MAG: carbamoyl phosphate synthase small subunit [Omnitrophica WOR_2 bacterium RIFOXYC2_FULL_43_9]HAH20678.1 carbamoyl phosphate synthase small subunit [Candidatus Omnitrophota bacterium]HBG62993.1 carbamoyl phosphate synthase small subunit [Candidatus Omnitrophota bacterium]
MKAILLLEDGTIFEGEHFGAQGEAFGEVVFNTSITGYQEIITDPSYKGQIVMMTYPLIGNYGVNEEDVESCKTWLEGFVVKELSSIRSNWRSTMNLDEYLRKYKVVGIQGIDTRALTRHLRIKGAMQGVISSEDFDIHSLMKKLKVAPRLAGVDLVKEVTCKEPYDWLSVPRPSSLIPRYKVIVLDCGVKFNILRNLTRVGCKVKVVPAHTPAEAILKLKSDGLLLSNGPGDPEAVTYVIETVRKLIGKLPIFGICLGHQMLGLALGGKTYKLKFGHHGGNHPVKDVKTGAVAITSQNHGFNVDMKSLSDKNLVMTHQNLYDGTAEGLEHKKLKLFSVQYHPEAGPGPHDARYLFERFVKLIRSYK